MTVYEKLMADYDKFTPEDFAELLRNNITEWMTKASAAKPPGPAPHVMSQQCVAVADWARPSTIAPSASSPPLPTRTTRFFLGALMGDQPVNTTHYLKTSKYF